MLHPWFYGKGKGKGGPKSFAALVEGCFEIDRQRSSLVADASCAFKLESSVETAASLPRGSCERRSGEQEYPMLSKKC